MKMTKASKSELMLVVLKEFQIVRSCLQNEASTSALKDMLKPVATISANGNCPHQDNFLTGADPFNRPANSINPKRIGTIFSGSFGRGFIATLIRLLNARAEDIPTETPTNMFCATSKAKLDLIRKLYVMKVKASEARIPSRIVTSAISFHLFPDVADDAECHD